MNNTLHATFTNADDGLHAVDSLLYHGARAEDISLILPSSPPSSGAEAAPSKKPPRRGNNPSEVILDTEQGAGLGLVCGLVAACCVPGIGLFPGSGTIVAGLLAGGAAVGGIAGGIYGHLIDCAVAHEVVQPLSDHIKAGGTTLSVTMSDAISEAEIASIIEGVGGHIIHKSSAP